MNGSWMTSKEQKAQLPTRGRRAQEAEPSRGRWVEKTRDASPSIATTTWAGAELTMKLFMTNKRNQQRISLVEGGRELREGRSGAMQACG